MAKYTINHICGHSREVSLYGKNKERERKIEWMENQDCPGCWGNKKRAEDDKKPIEMTVTTNGLTEDESGNLLVEIVLRGGTRQHKDQISALGYCFTEVTGGALNMLSMSRPEKAWTKPVKFDEQTIATTVKQDADALGVTPKINIDPLSLELARKRLAKKRADNERIAALNKPECPDCHPRARHKGRWNGTYYGGKGNRTYYVDGQKHTLNEEEYNQCMEYRKALASYNDQIQAIKNAD